MSKKKKKQHSENEELDIYKFNPDFNKVIINLEDFNKKNILEQQNTIETTLKGIYNGTFKINKRYVEKCISITCDPQDVIEYLPYGLMVEKRKGELIFKYNKKFNKKLIVALVLLFLFATLAASYSAVNFLSKASLNKDLNGDGVPDINIDLDGDEEPDINIDINGDNIPELNIDYKNNQMSIFSIDKDKDEKADYNLINQDKNNDGKCDLNCDIDEDGWPDINLDTNGDGVADIDIDTDGDKKADMNLDLDGDMQCDLYCDTNGDLKCDKFCAVSDNQLNEEEEKKKKEEQKKKREAEIRATEITEEGSSDRNVVTPQLLIVYKDSSSVEVKELFPTDQEEGKNSQVPNKVFTIENQSTIDLKYSVSWEVLKNTFISENFQYKVTSTNGGGTLDWTTAPKTNTTFFTTITIPARTIQSYTVSFRLKGVNGEQNYDQNRTFQAKLKVDPINRS